MPILFSNIHQFVDSAGPMAGAYIESYDAGTTTHKLLYADRALTQPHPWPIVAQSTGIFPEFFCEGGLYKIILYNKNNSVIASRDYISSFGSGDNSGTDSYKVMATSADGLPDYLLAKMTESSTVAWRSEAYGGGYRVAADVKTSGILDYKVKVSSSGNPGYLPEKVQDTSTIAWTVSADKMEATYVGPHWVRVDDTDTVPSNLYTKFQDSSTIHWEATGAPSARKVRANIEPGAGDTYKVMATSADLIPGYLGTKIRPGTGVTFTETEDGVNGKQLHVSVNNPDSGKIRVDGDDISLGYLSTKLVAGANITLTREIIEGADARLRISASPGAALGYMEDVKEFVDAITIGSSTDVFNVCQLDLTAGTWDLSGTATTYAIKDGGAAFIHTLGNIIVSTSGTIPYDGYESFAGVQTVTGGASASANIPRRRFVLATPTTIYLCVQIRSGTFTGALAWGNLSAVQVA